MVLYSVQVNVKFLITIKILLVRVSQKKINKIKLSHTYSMYQLEGKKVPLNMIHTEQKSMKVKLLLVYISAQFNSMHEKCFHSNEERAVHEIQQKTMRNINRESQIFRQI